MFQISMTSMNETDRSPSKVDMNSGSQDFFNTARNPLGILDKVEGAVKYVVPNSVYMVKST
jgi:hypothetical protein